MSIIQPPSLALFLRTSTEVRSVSNQPNLANLRLRSRNLQAKLARQHVVVNRVEGKNRQEKMSRLALQIGDVWAARSIRDTLRQPMDSVADMTFAQAKKELDHLERILPVLRNGTNPETNYAAKYAVDVSSMTTDIAWSPEHMIDVYTTLVQQNLQQLSSRLEGRGKRDNRLKAFTDLLETTCADEQTNRNAAREYKADLFQLGLFPKTLLQFRSVRAQLADRMRLLESIRGNPDVAELVNEAMIPAREGERATTNYEKFEDLLVKGRDFVVALGTPGRELSLSTPLGPEAALR